MKFEKSSLRTRIIVMGLVMTLSPVVVMTLLTLVGKQKMNRQVNTELTKQTTNQLSSVTSDIYAICKSQQESIQKSVDSNMNVARLVLQRSGGLSIRTGTSTWNAKDQLSGDTSTVQLPNASIGGSMLTSASAQSSHVPVVDEVTKLVGGACTIFLKMNPRGDMLRVATNVRKADGKRATGTYIGMIKPDGTRNPILEAVLRGETYRGRAFVVDSWYIASYGPIKSRSGEIIGMLFVGLKQENVNSLREAILSRKIGKTGYVFVVGATDPDKGKYIISRKGERDGENIWNAKDSNGNQFVQKLVNRALEIKDDEIFIQSYPWKNPGESKPRMKTVAVAYFKPWDWVIGTGAYNDEFEAVQHRVDDGINGVMSKTLLGVLLVALLLLAYAAKFAKSVTGPLANVVAMLRDMAEGEGDLTKRLKPTGTSETVDLANWFNAFIEKTHDIIYHVRQSADSVANSTNALSTTANEVSLATQQISETVGQVANSSQNQSENVQTSANAMSELSKAIGKVADGAQKQARTVDQTVDLVQQISAAIGNVSTLSQEAAANGQQVTEVANVGGKQIAEAVEGMDRIKDATDKVAELVKELGKSSQQIGMIVETISDIAEQTNLLALNAAIEAARAGEHGKGFAVVADEVRKLAERSSSATGEISALITHIQQMTENAVSAMSQGSQEVANGTQIASQAGQALVDIQDAVRSIVDQIKEMSSATQQMSGSNIEIVKAIENVSTITAQTTESAGEMAVSSEKVTEQIEQVASASEQNAAASQQVSATTQQQMASIEELTASAEGLASMAGDLRELVAKFKISDKLAA